MHRVLTRAGYEPQSEKISYNRLTTMSMRAPDDHSSSIRYNVREQIDRQVIENSWPRRRGELRVGGSHD